MCEHDACCQYVDDETIHQEIEQIIARSGYGVQWVSDGAGEPCFAYTIGLTNEQLPELIVFGLSSPVSAELCKAVASQLRAGIPLGAGQHLTLPDGLRLRLDQVTDTTEYLIYANEHCGEPGAPVRALQLVWPDWAGRFPGERDCTLTTADQILLR